MTIQCENCGREIQEYQEIECGHCGTKYCGGKEGCTAEIRRYKVTHTDQSEESVYFCKEFNQCPSCGGWHRGSSGNVPVDDLEEDFKETGGDAYESDDSMEVERKRVK